MTSLAERHQRFRDLHQSGCFVIPNPWDMGSARIMAAAGAVALATTSAGFAFTLGRPDMGRVTREEALKHAEDIVRATPLPVSGGFRPWQTGRAIFAAWRLEREFRSLFATRSISESSTTRFRLVS